MPAVLAMTDPAVTWLNEIASKWQEVWRERKVYMSDPSDKSKFYITAAFPYPNSPIHIGNSRSFITADFIARFYRLKGYNTLYPMGFHYTGTPILTMAESIASGDKELYSLFVDLYDVPPDEVSNMKEPLYLARYFHRVSKESMIRLGLSIDWRREFTTVDPLFSTFIKWQFNELKKKGYLIKGSYPVGWCPKHNMPVGGHDTKDDKDPEIDSFTLILFNSVDGEYVFPAATLRPETIFGVTNIWINPGARYVKVMVDGSVWIVSYDSYTKLKYQKKDIKLVGDIDPGTLIGRFVVNPVTGEEIQVIGADFVEPEFGTGIVMSVPSHSPDDYLALSTIDRDRFRVLEPRPLIEVRHTIPKDTLASKWILDKYGVKSFRDRSRLEKAVKELYSLEFNSGTMIHGISKYIRSDIEGARYLKAFVKGWIEGRPVAEARENIIKLLKLTGSGDTIYEIINKPVYCRCGTEIVVKILEDQWFIDYGNEEWKRTALEHVDAMEIYPREAKDHIKLVIKSLREKPCARTRGLGTSLPWDPSWIIESLSDSTIYMVYYTVAHKIRDLEDRLVKDQELANRFWRYIVHGKGNPRDLAKALGVSEGFIKDLREEFTYWYPLDVRVAGKDLANNHLPFFIMNHIAILPRELWPKGIIVHGWVLRDGDKMSKSKRNILPALRAVNMYSSDGLRLMFAIQAELSQDLDFRSDEARKIPYILRDLYNNIAKFAKHDIKDSADYIDKIYSSKLARTLNKAIEMLEGVRVRDAAIEVVYNYPRLLNSYIEKTKEVYEEIYSLTVEWTKILSVFTPHIAEEIWSGVFGKSSNVVVEKIDMDAIARNIDYSLELQNEYITMVKNDIREIISLIKAKPRKIYIYVSEPFEIDILRDSIRIIEKGGSLRDLINKYIGAYSLPKERASLRLKKIYQLASEIPENIRELILNSGAFDEFKVISGYKDQLTREFGSDVVIYRSMDESVKDLGGKKKDSLPLKPGIYIEFEKTTI